MNTSTMIPVIAIDGPTASGKGAVAQGRLGADGQLIASEVLAKHDENYVAPGVEILHKPLPVKQ